MQHIGKILAFPLFILLCLLLVAGCSGGDKTPCAKACSKYQKCNKPQDKGAPDGKAAGKDAGPGSLTLFMAGGPGSGSCSYSELCSPKEQCFSACINGATCGALTGKVPAEVKTVNDCLNVCSKKKWDGGVNKDGGACKPQCGNRQCGPNGCGGQCGTCPTGKSCDTKGMCVTGGCQPQCAGKQCGPNGCGGQCGTCSTGKYCNSSGQCVTSCTPNCTNKQCGGNGCGGSCGTCQSGSQCNTAGRCIPNCQPNCTNKNCGDNGCGGSCGTCPANEQCGATGYCEPKCVPDCNGKVCGSDSCGGSCGTCKSYETCDSTGACQQTGCGPITQKGCCDGQTLKYCENSTYKTLDCNQNPSCGWDSYGSLYDCGTAGYGDSSGTYPKACP